MAHPIAARIVGGAPQVRPGATTGTQVRTLGAVAERIIGVNSRGRCPPWNSKPAVSQCSARAATGPQARQRRAWIVTRLPPLARRAAGGHKEGGQLNEPAPRTEVVLSCR